MSAVAPSIKKSTQIVKRDNRVSEAQNQDIMNNLLGELDKNDEDDLQEIGQAMGGVLDQIGVEELEDVAGGVAFNQQDKFNQKYNVAVGSVGSKKRTLDDMETAGEKVARSATRPANPFARKLNPDVTVGPEPGDHSLFPKDAQEEKSAEKAGAQATSLNTPMEAVGDSKNIQEKMLD